MKIRDVLIFILSVALCLVPGVVGSIFTTSAIPTWYAGLVKPAFNPPNWVFGPVWTALYLMMGIALFLVVRDGMREPRVKVAAALFVAQLFLNGLWSYIFFGLRSPGWALVEILALWISILVTIVACFRVSRAAGWLLVPYILWVTFAAVLNGAIWRLNG
jgi:benzodiazapine receptor